MNCDKCQSKLFIGVVFCSECGQKVEKNEIKTLCYDYFAFGVWLCKMMANKKIGNKNKVDYLNDLKEISPEMCMIHENPEDFLFGSNDMNKEDFN